ncbi:hypothetical protein GSI_03532 [Ganoderma sinense ZZ0214-1]|uniref:EF-hand domain-containing protein n=1 Tax=Ganoderma sinense ZZ0214-1 TaxID=1077348 RepID=A0A2G8SJ71_9APHY|nr:hypothetical protein GSI_03532 [Ganoderma sinense ZZ0214-1]
MPSFFGKNLKTPNPVPPSVDADTAAAAASSSAAPKTEASASAAKPDGKDENVEVAAIDPINGAFQAVQGAEPSVQKYASSRLRKTLDKTGDVIGSVQGSNDTATSVVDLVKPAYDSDLMQPVKDGINKLGDSLPGLLKALNEVAQIHPFIAIAVGAFRVVVELDVKRRDNDKKIGLLFVEMRDMMEALLQLRGITDPESVGPDGQTIKARMQELVKQTAEDIKACANECDTYAKKKLLVKVIASSSWDERLKTFIDLFANRRKAFTFALSIHVGVGVDDANRRLKEIDAKVDVLLAIFPRILSPEQQELAALVEKKGGPRVVMGDNDALVELLKFRPAVALDQDKRSGGREGAESHNGHLGGGDLAAVKQELFDSPESAVKKNLEAFERKFDLQHKALMDNFGAVVSHEGDRVIQAVTAGPHDRIIDPDIHEIWKDMRWPGHVKARHFVLALRDYYRQQVRRKREASPVDNVKSRLADGDEWALEWININRLQAIVEAFDDDASGFITVEEVNYFTTSRPKGWSLPHWLAYWAIGWQMTTTKYRDMVVNICAKMFAIRPHIHPANRHAVDKYLQSVWQKITTLTLSFVNTNQPDSLQDRFKSYVEAEENRLREGLETVRYDIDAMDTLLLHLFPLLWLLLRRDFEIFRLCRHTLIHKDELWDSADTILWVLDAVSERHNDLDALFKQQKLDPGSQFRSFACELYDYWHDFDRFWMLENQRGRDFAEVEYDDAKEDHTVDVSKLLNYPSAADDLYPARVEDSATHNDAAADEGVRLVWNGIQISEDDIVSPMITFYLHASVDPRTYGASSVGANGTDYNILGEYTTNDDGTTEYSFTQTYVARIPKTYWTATLEDDAQTLSGRWGYDKDDQPWTFVFKRVSPEVLVDRPHPKEFAENRIKALWKYALTAVRNQVRRRLFSWAYLAERRDRRKEYLELLLKESDGQLTREDTERASALAQRSTFDEVRCFYIRQEYRQRAVPPHFGITCDSCREPIYGTRVVCMECGLRFTFDFCDKPACVGCTIESRDDLSSPHVPTHDFVKVRAPILHHREIGRVLRDAKAGLERAKGLLDEMEFRRRAREFLKIFEEGQGGDGEKTGEDGGENGGDGDDEDEEGTATSPETGFAPARPELVESPKAELDDEVPALACLRCKSVISRPCLYCVDCPEDSAPFICWDCDEREAGFDQGEHHLATHNLVRCMEVLEEEVLGSGEDTTEKRLGALEEQMVGLRDQMAKIEALLHALANARTG